MRVLNFYSSVFGDQLRRGRKTATIRLGDKSHKYHKNECVLVTIGYQHSPREKIFNAVIDQVEVKRVRDLSPREIEHDNPEFRRVDEMIHFLEQIYGRKVSMDDTVTVVRFSQIIEGLRKGSATGSTASAALATEPSLDATSAQPADAGGHEGVGLTGDGLDHRARAGAEAHPARGHPSVDAGDGAVLAQPDQIEREAHAEGMDRRRLRDVEGVIGREPIEPGQPAAAGAVGLRLDDHQTAAVLSPREPAEPIVQIRRHRTGPVAGRWCWCWCRAR